MFKKIFKEVLDKAVPSKKESKNVKKCVDNFVSVLNVQLKKCAIDAKAVAGGSFAKGVWLSGDFDVDVFVKFNSVKYAGKNISDLLETALLFFEPVRVHGSRDYFWVDSKLHFEVIPVLDIKKPMSALNVTDCSPLHVAWVKKQGKNFLNDIRLAKLFCKANGCYGAESYIRGFSGHVIDILVVNYKGFLPLLRAASKWKSKTVIDVNKFHKGKALFNINKSKTEGPLVLVDPVDPFRNSSAALSLENFDRFVRACKSFLKKPSYVFFEVRPVDFVKLRRKGHLFVVNIVSLSVKRDVAGAKFVCAFDFVKKQLKDFSIIDSGWRFGKDCFWFFVLKNNKLPDFFELKGPPENLADSVAVFKNKHDIVFKRDGRFFAKIKRTLTSADDILLQCLCSDYVLQRVKSAKIINC